MTNIFELKIDFERGSGNPTRVFRSMTSLIEATSDFDSDLISSIGARVKTDLILEDIQTGSLRSQLSSALKEIDGEALRSGDWKRVLGTYLDKGRLTLIEKLDEKPKIESKEQLVLVQRELHKLALKTDAAFVPHYEPIALDRLLKDIQTFRMGMAYLGEKDAAFVILEGTKEQISKDIEINPDLRDEIMIKESISNTSDAILKVKKPDYIGRSMWQFRFSDHVIEAKIEDEKWLSDFQSRRQEVQPGDSLKVSLETTLDYGFSGDVVDSHYKVKKVYKIMRGGRFEQLEME